MSRITTLTTRLLSEARAALDNGDTSTATERLLDVLAIDPENAIATRLIARPSQHRLSAGENKLLTIVFTDQVGSTAFAEHHGDEATKRVYELYHELFGRAVETYGGLIHSYQGDGAVACFGHPVAHENDAERALEAALAMVASLGPLERRVHDELQGTFVIRIGVHTGSAVIGDLGTATSPLPNAITGLTPNIASRIQDLAGHNEILISAATANLVHKTYDLEPKGEHQLKGVSGMWKAYRVVGRKSSAQSENRALLSPLVGRGHELAALSDLWGEVVNSHGGRSALISGAAGMGKSRLLNFIRDVCKGAGGVSIAARTSDLERSQPLRYIARTLAHYLPDPEDDAWSRHTRALNPQERQALAALFSPMSASIATELEPGELRRRSIEALEHWLASAAAQAPTCLILDDFQWADPTSRTWVTSYATRLPDSLFLLIASRDVEEALRVDAAVELFPLDDNDAKQLVTNLVPGAADVIDSVVRAADGLPLFLEELAHAGRADAIPETLREVVQAELEPEAVRHFAQLLATVGRTVPEPILHRVAEHLGYHSDDFRQNLDALLTKGVVEQFADAEYGFRHHLVWKAAYESQLTATRIERHRSVAEALCSIAAPERNEFADLIGRQYLQGGKPVEGCTFLLGAASQSQALGAHGESLEQLSLIQEAMSSLPAEVAPVFEVGLRMRRALSLAVTNGYADPGVQADFEGASETSRRLLRIDELRTRLAPALVGLWSYYAVVGDFTKSQPIIDDLESHAAGTFRSHAITVIASLDRWFRGKVDEAHAFIMSIESELDDSHMPRGWSLPNDPAVCGLACAAAVSLMRNELAAAEDFVDRALRRAESISFPVGPLSAALTHTYVAMAHGVLGNHDLQAHHGAHAMAIGNRHGFTEWQMLGEIHTLAGRALSGEAHLADELDASITRWRATGAGVCVPALLGLQAELALESGDERRAQRLVDEALVTAEHTAQGLGLERLARLRERLAQPALVS